MTEENTKITDPQILSDLRGEFETGPREQLSKMQKTFLDDQKEFDKRSEEIEKHYPTQNIGYIGRYADKTDSKLKGVYNGDTDTITINHALDEGGLGFIPNETTLDTMSTLVHEDGHQDNKGIYDRKLSLPQVYTLNQNDETAQNLRELLFRRSEYLRTGDIDVFDDPDDRFRFYADAINSGMNPKNSEQDPKAFDEEMDRIFNGTRDMWIKSYKDNYRTQNENVAKGYFCKRGDQAQENIENYNQGLNDLYTIGGVNFNKYRKDDFVCDSPEINDLQQKIDSGQLSPQDIEELKAQFQDKETQNQIEKEEKGFSASINDSFLTIQNTLEDGTREFYVTGGDYENMGFTKKIETEIPDLSHPDFIKKPKGCSQNAQEESNEPTDIAEKINDLRGLGSKSPFGDGAGSLKENSNTNQTETTAVATQTAPEQSATPTPAVQTVLQSGGRE